MYYNSINNKLNIKQFCNIFFSNIPKNKTLFFPFKLPFFNNKYLNYLKKLNYVNFSFEISKLFLNNISDEDLYKILYNSYNNKKFIKLEKISNENHLLNLNNGFTLTFKDIAMIPLSNLINYFSFKNKKKFIIFCATSGDTGASANNSFKNIKNVKIFTFYPFNMVSNIQRKQMSTLISKNILNYSIIGNFDISQYFVKKIFENIKNNEKIFLLSVNSINWFRIIMQLIYYCYISIKNYNEKKFNFIIPSGNFGNALSAYLSKKIGFPINKIIPCTNDNFYLDNYIKNNKIENILLKRTISPSIDISIPSNFIRLINKNFFKKKIINEINNDIFSDKIYNKHIINSIEYFYQKYNKIYDPHTITSISSFYKDNNDNNNNNNKIVVSTSYPIKFIFSIKKIIPNIKIKFNIKKIFSLKEKYKLFSQNFLVLINSIKKNINV
ncbi:threonine synthase [Candidatus Carsonella ruddii]|uniref:Threonine synthase n=1 Tax=Candidatus Carsonella ruddii HC isolate Thao2000 TaxID=1202538 RepID=J3TEA8_CARRU|nr:threonine synthase [Candidatus Carsonella ruddii]AFP83987.1 threonine synthase [Candidatus Carsonella ruddii HC isolate Thao2000]